MNDVLSQANNSGNLIAIDRLIYNPDLKQLFADEQPIELEPRTVELLEVLLSHVGSPLSAEKIISQVWQSDYISRNVLTNRISTLRAIFKQYAPESDPSKLLVTYPKKGYYFSQDKVKLVTRNTDTQTVTPVNSAPPEKRRAIHIRYLIALCCLTLLALWSWQSSVRNIATTNRDSNITVPVVELLLNRIVAGDKLARKYRKEIKVLLLNQQINYPFTSIANQDAPGYFLAPISDGRYWPGARNIISSDYRLNLELTSDELSQKLSANVDIVHHQSEKVAYRATYQLDPEQLPQEVYAIGQDLVRFFQLPRIEQPDFSNLTLQKIMHQPIEQSVAETIKLGVIKEISVGYLTREILTSEQFSRETIANWTTVIENSFRYHSEETDIWLALLYFRLGDHNAAREYLIKARFNQQVDNAFLYLVLSNIALETKKADAFRVNYLKSMVALTKSIPSEVIFKRLSKPESSQTCLSPWLTIVSHPSFKKQRTKAWVETFSDYCQRAEVYL